MIFKVQPGSIQEKPYRIRAVATYNGHDYASGYEQTGYSACGLTTCTILPTIRQPEST